jgi:hypothetical protein
VIMGEGERGESGKGKQYEEERRKKGKRED